MNTIQIVRGICIVLVLVTLGVAAYLWLHREAALGIKLGWITAILALIALAPEKLPFLSSNAGTCLFFRNAFGGVFLVLFLVNIFVIFWIQLPQEKVPHFDGKVVELVNSHGPDTPRIEFYDKAGKQNVFDDSLAHTIFPQHTFVVGERFSVRAPTNASPHVAHSALARWGAAILLILIAALAFGLSLACHLRYLSLLSHR